jgi:hypothetical protein
MANSLPYFCLSKERLDAVVEAMKSFMSSESIRTLSHREIQCKAWHCVPEVASYMAHLRRLEETVKSDIMREISQLIYQCNVYSLEMNSKSNSKLARKASWVDTKKLSFHKFCSFCLDAKERLYLILKTYGWLPEFFRLYPQHFYENSFHFVSKIPRKKLPIKVRVVGLGIAGSLAVSGLAKMGIETIIGFETRPRKGPSGVASRYQNASWRAFDVSRNMLDETAYKKLEKYRQRLNTTDKEGSTKVVSSERVQIIIGDAINTSIESANRYNADLRFGCTVDNYYDSTKSANTKSEKANEKCDIVALFCGAHTADRFSGLKEEMGICSWPALSSKCKTWLRIQESKCTDMYCTRGGNIGAEKWYFTVANARDKVHDILRVKYAVTKQWERETKAPNSDQRLKSEYEAKLGQLDKVLKRMGEKNKGNSNKFDYIFTNAPDNEVNLAKRKTDGMDGSVVIDGGYTVDVKISSRAVVGGVSFQSY